MMPAEHATVFLLRLFAFACWRARGSRAGVNAIRDQRSAMDAWWDLDDIECSS